MFNLLSFFRDKFSNGEEDRESEEEVKRKEEALKESLRQEKFKSGLFDIGAKLSFSSFLLALLILSAIAWSRGIAASYQTKTQSLSSDEKANTVNYLTKLQSVNANEKTDIIPPKIPLKTKENESKILSNIQPIIFDNKEKFTSATTATTNTQIDCQSKKNSKTNFLEEDIENFSLTYVVYKKSDNFGKFLALLTLSPVFIVVYYVTLIASRRDFDTMYTFLGQIIGVALCVFIKKYIKQPRPDGAHLEDEGMPSNHVRVFSVCLFVFKFKVSINKYYIYLCI